MYPNKPLFQDADDRIIIGGILATGTVITRVLTAFPDQILNVALVLGSYVVTGIIAAAAYVYVTKLWGDPLETRRRLILGAIAGFFSYFVAMAMAPDQATSPLAYLTVGGAGYGAVDFLSALLSRRGDQPGDAGKK